MLQYMKAARSKIHTVLVMVGLVCLTLTAGAAKPQAPAIPAKPAAVKESPKVMAKAVANPHLHNAKTVVAAAKATKNKKLAKHWQHRWSFAEWAVVHRGTGTVMGEVRNSSGSAVAGALVHLKKPNGTGFRNVSLKHFVHTGSAGTFIMRHVRIGSYRVRGDKGKANGHVSVHLSGGHTVMAAIKV